LLLLLCLAWVGANPFARAEPLAFVEAPGSVADLRDIERDIRVAVDRVLPATVGVQVGASQGSGVIVSNDGLVLTAGHVISDAGRDCTIILPDGKRLKAKTLGLNRDIDSGMIKITEHVELPFVDRGKSSDLRPGQWVIALGHPGGYRPGRPPVVRVGRIIDRGDGVIRTDTTLVGGDSGGPLIDLDGRVVGIHSRIGASTTANLHVPVDTYADTWDRLLAGETWGGRFGGALGRFRGPIIGITGADHERGCLVETVAPDLPASRAGLRPGDIIVRINGEDVAGLNGLQQLLSRRRAGEEISLEVLRDGETIRVKLAPVARPRGM
jgi:serine protease Do